MKHFLLMFIYIFLLIFLAAFYNLPTSKLRLHRFTLVITSREVCIMCVTSKSPSRLTSILAILVAIGALAASTWQGFELRKNFRVSARPLLDLDPDMSSSGNFYGFVIENEGEGPAIIHNVQLDFGGTRADNTERNGWKEILTEMGLWGQEHGVSYRTLYPNEVLGAGIKAPYLGIFETNFTPERAQRFKAKVPSLTIEICYCSVYEQCESYRTGYHVAPSRRQVKNCNDS